ncbi:stam-1 [Acrasis kona]|uniref:Stam-1 n=1 Tax=Acrasis kona TaxID=1008807 RepID=A0AAW2YJN8_9EUKA
MSDLTALINKVTTPGPMEDWDTILQICDVLSHRPDDTSKIVMDGIYSKLVTPNVAVQLLAVTLLDACIKNTTPLFFRLASNPNNINVVESLTRSSNVELREKAQTLLNELQSSGLPPSAPTTSSEEPLVRPQRSKEEKRQKIEKDLVVVNDSCRELISRVDADIKDEATTQLVHNCDEMHRRLVALIEKVPEEDLLLKLIECNEELCSAIDYYDEYRKSGSKNRSLLKLSSKPTSSAPAQPDAFMDFFTGTPVQQPSYVPSSQPVSLDALLNQPQRHPLYSDSITSELQRIERRPLDNGLQQVSSPGFEALARRHNQPKPVPAQTSPNPFDIEFNTQKPNEQDPFQ